MGFQIHENDDIVDDGWEMVDDQFGGYTHLYLVYIGGRNPSDESLSRPV